MVTNTKVPLSQTSSDDEIRDAVSDWVEANVPETWRAAAPGGRAAIRKVRPRADYEAWYPTFADSGLAVATWPVAYLGLDLSVEQARVVESVLGPFNLGRLNPLVQSTCAASSIRAASATSISTPSTAPSRPMPSATCWACAHLNRDSPYLSGETNDPELHQNDK